MCTGTGQGIYEETFIGWDHQGIPVDPRIDPQYHQHGRVEISQERGKTEKEDEEILKQRAARIAEQKTAFGQVRVHLIFGA